MNENHEEMSNEIKKLSITLAELLKENKMLKDLISEIKTSVYNDMCDDIDTSPCVPSGIQKLVSVLREKAKTSPPTDQEYERMQTLHAEWYAR